MARETKLYGDERPLPYWVRLARIDQKPVRTYGTEDDSMQTLLHLDLRGGEFTRPSADRLAKVFDWLTRAFKIRHDDVVDHCLVITPVDPEQDFRTVDATITGQRPESWPARRAEAFRWVPIAYYDDQEVRYAWQR